MDRENSQPSKPNLVLFTPIIITGSNIGNERIGNKALLLLDLDIIAEMIVVQEEIPKLPKIILNQNISGVRILTLSLKIKNISKIAILVINDKHILKRSFPKNTEEDEDINCKSKPVPRSSSLTNDLEILIIAVKNIIIHRSPAITPS